MSVIDKIMNLMHLNTEDEDDLDLIEETEIEESELPQKHFGREKRERESFSHRAETIKEKPPVKVAPNISSFSKSSKKQQGAGMEVCVIKPSSVEDSREITETLLNGRTVLLNVEGLNVDIAQRIIDFTSGSCFAISGNLQKISNFIFVITPSTVDISGDVAQDMLDSFEFSDIDM